jgi:hypothetical protein
LPGDPEIAEALVLLSCGEQMLIILLDSSFPVDLLMNIGVWRLVVIFGWRVFVNSAAEGDKTAIASKTGIFFCFLWSGAVEVKGF